MSSVAILLATYNSEIYLTDLLDSILNQSFTDWDLYIIDDCSVDSTIEILTEYSKISSKIHVVGNVGMRNGPKNNFFYLLKNIDSAYYMFCDHDDVWLPFKIEKSLNEMIKLESNNSLMPILIHSDLKVVDNNLNIISDSFFQYAGIIPDLLLSSFKHLSHSNCVTGCTMLFNNRCKEISYPVSKNALMHDSWIALSVMSYGGIIYCIKDPLILYRQHENNTLGAIYNGAKSIFRVSISANLKQYKMAKDIRRISFFTFVLYRFIYVLKRRYYACCYNCNI